MQSQEIMQLALRAGPGQHRVQCPFCSQQRRKKHLKDLSLTVEQDHALYFCHHCGEQGATSTTERATHTRERPAMSVKKDLPTRDLSDDVTKWLKDERGISVETARKLGCVEMTQYFGEAKCERSGLAFAYYNRQEPYAFKLRTYPDKFHTCNGSPQTLYNYTAIENWNEIVITEGEMDVLAMTEAEIVNAVSIPSGAFTKPKNPNAEMRSDNGKFRWINHHADKLEKAKKIYIATDADEPGEYTGEQIARRLGKDRCYRVSYPEGCKDANDVLLKHGAQALRDAVEGAKPWPVEGLHDVGHFATQLEDMWDNGLSKGADTGLAELDRLYSVTPGQLTVVTGHPSNGKTELVDQLMVHLAEKHGWKAAVCSFENEPRLHIANLIGKYIGQTFFGGPAGRMTLAQRDAGYNFIKAHFTFLHNDGDDLTTLDSILTRLRVAVMRHDIRMAVIDPYNYISKSKDKSETEWVSEMLSRVRKFAQAHSIHVFFVAHPTKMPANTDGSMSVPKGNTISGSAAWWAKADMGVTAHRPDPQFSNETEIHVWKSRYAWSGSQGVASVYYNRDATRFCCHGDIVKPKVF